MAKPTKPFDSALAHLCRVVSEVSFQCILHFRPKAGLKSFEIIDGFGGEYDLVSHSGHNIARFNIPVKLGRSWRVYLTLRLSTPFHNYGDVFGGAVTQQR